MSDNFYTTNYWDDLAWHIDTVAINVERVDLVIRNRKSSSSIVRAALTWLELAFASDEYYIMGYISMTNYPWELGLLNFNDKTIDAFWEKNWVQRDRINDPEAMDYAFVRSVSTANHNNDFLKSLLTIQSTNQSTNDNDVPDQSIEITTIADPNYIKHLFSN